jgi:hypothetical protein
MLDRCGAEEMIAVDDDSAWWGGVAGFVLGGWLDGGLLSSAIGAGIGSWISKNVFGRDVEKETKDKLIGLARNAKPVLRAAAEKHLDAVERLIDDTGQVLPQQRPAPSDLRAVEARERRLAKLLVWCQKFQDVVAHVRQEFKA